MLKHSFLISKPSWPLLIFQASNSTFCYRSAFFISPPTASSPLSLLCPVFFHTLWYRLSLSSFISARRPALARTTAPTSSPGPSLVTALSTSRPTTPSRPPASLALTPPRNKGTPPPTIAKTRVIGVLSVWWGCTESSGCASVEGGWEWSL